MNLSTIREQAAKFAGDVGRTRFSDSDYLVAINRAQEQFALETRALWKDITYSSVANDATYALPSAFMFEESVHFDGKPLLPLSRRDLAILAPDSDWTDDTGTPTHYLVDPEEAQKMLLLYPIPQAGDAQKNIVMRYFPLPTELSGDNDTPLNSSALLAQFHIGLSAYAAWVLMTGEEMTPEVLSKRRELLAIYSDAASKATDLFKNTYSAPWRLRGTRPIG